MSKQVDFSLLFTVDNKDQFNINDYFTWTDKVEPYGDSTWVGDGVFRWTGRKTEKFSFLNQHAMNSLFPNDYAKPIAGKIGGNVARTGLSGTAYLRGYINGTNVFEKSRGATSYSEGESDIPANVLSAMSKSSEIKWGGQMSNTVSEVISGKLYITLTFTQYAFSAYKTGVGISSTSVSRQTGYDGDSVTYTAGVKSGATWKGWYADEQCTSLVSTSQTYSTTPNSDLVLYACAETADMGLRIKRNSTWTRVHSVFRKVNGSWVELDKDTARDIINNNRLRVMT